MTTVAKYCEACGGEAVDHGQEYLAVLLDMAALRFINLPHRFLERHINTAYLFNTICTALAARGWGQWLEQPDDQTLLASKVLWQEAQKRDIVVKEFRLFGRAQNSFLATLPDDSILDFDGVPLPPSRAHWGINHKPVLKKKFQALGLPVPKGGAAFTQKKAWALFDSLATNAVVKPAVGSASRHTTMHVATREALEAAFASARQVSPAVIVEEELPGPIYRPTVVGGKLIATLRRDQPHVFGDGERTVAELVAEANKHPARGGPYFHPIVLNDAAAQELGVQGLSAASVPATGARVRLHPKINWALGGTTADVSDDVHPENKKMFERVAEVLRTPLVGIDFIAEDISTPWQEQRCGIIECNDMPFFDNHHLPFEGAPRDVAGPIWDLILK